MPQGKQTVSDDDIIETILQHDDPFVRSDEIAEEFGHTRQWAHERLQQLHDEGDLKKKGGNRSVIWWVPKALC